MKIAVLVSGGGSNLQALIDAQNRNELGGGILSLVISSKEGVYALERAKNAGIPTLVLSRNEYDSPKAYGDAILLELQKEDIDILVYAGFMCIVEGELLRVYKNRMINVHPSLIPSFCGPGFYGLKVHEAVLEKGVKVTGATVHIVTEECDAGPILLQKAVEVLDTDTPETLQKRVMEQAEWILLPKAVRLLCENKVTIKENRTYIK